MWWCKKYIWNQNTRQQKEKEERKREESECHIFMLYFCFLWSSFFSSFLLCVLHVCVFYTFKNILIYFQSGHHCQSNEKAMEPLSLLRYKSDNIFLSWKCLGLYFLCDIYVEFLIKIEPLSLIRSFDTSGRLIRFFDTSGRHLWKSRGA